MMMNQYTTIPDYYPNGRGQYYDQFGVASFPYRPVAAPTVQLPLRPTTELGLPELHHQHHQPPTSHNVNHHNHQLLHAHQHHQQQQQQQRQQHPHAQSQHIHAQNMADWQTEEDLAEFQELSNKYEPEATGPLVGERQSSSALTTEYAAADPIYQAKTAKLPQNYSHYRTCRGDGRCGWRAIAFAYFESLLRLRNKSKFLEEETRLKSLHNLMNAAGFDKWAYEDYADETYGLLRKYMGMVDAVNVEESLVADFNNEELQNYIITHFKVLAAAWMKTRPDEYAPFILPQTVDSYVDSAIMPHGTEIDHPGINAITDILLKPAHIALDVIYLDLSQGDDATTHQFAAGIDAATTINLLYRPGHYDILYKREVNAQPPPPHHPISAATYLQYGTYDEEPITDIGVPDFLALMPGMSMVPNQSNWMSNPNQFYQPPEPTFAVPPLPVQHHAPPPIATVAPVYSLPTPAVHASPMSPTTSQDFYGAATPSVDPLIHHGHDLLGFTNGSNPFRPSRHMYSHEVVSSSARHIDFQTTQFRNSHFNTSHFLNPDFHPDEWSPEQDYITPNNRSKHKPSKSFLLGLFLSLCMFC